jgi:hypothetical protein
MKIRRSILFHLSIFLLSLGLVINPLNIGGLPIDKVNAQSSVRPYVVFVNGYQDCCTWGRYTNGSPDPYMDIVVGALPSNSEIRYVPWDRFEDSANQRSSTSNDAEFLRQATEFINQLDPNRPLILIGHSFGGDSLLSLASRISRRIQFLGVIDPTAAGGLREPVTRRGVPSNVDYFFNRWQQNALASANVVPFDSRVVNGSISGCRAGSCDQQEQSLARRQDGSEMRVSCEAHEVSCEGWRLPGCNFSGCWRGSNGTKAKRLSHNDMPLDEYLQRQMADRISSVIANFRPPTQPSVGYFDNGATVFYSNGSSYCGFASPNHLQFFRNVNSAPSLGRRDPGNFGTYTGACPLPSGYFDNGATVFFSQGNGTFCGFADPQSYDSHGRSRPQLPRFGRLDSDPNSFMSYTGVCQ